MKKRCSNRRGAVRELAAALEIGPNGLLAFIEKHSIPEPNSGCWLWLGSVSADGYGKMVDPRRPIKRSAMPRVGIHRLVCEVVHRPMQPNEDARHLCHNKGCVNPEHLLPGTRSDNLNDSVRAGHWTNSVGSLNGRAKLTEDAVERLRREFKPNTEGQAAHWGASLGVSEGKIRDAFAGRTWRHVLAGTTY